jgi:mevalonate kinase
MTAITVSVPGKIILFGEHAVVYGRPAIAVPVFQVQARALVKAEPHGQAGCIRVQAPDIHLDAWLADLPEEDPLRSAVRGTLEQLKISRPPACTLQISSTIPVASGLGSGAAVSIAIIRALSTFLGQPLDDERVCSLAFEVEKIHHGTPSGIDNTVIAYAMPIYFVRGQPIERFHIGRPLTLVIGDTGIPSPTARAVGDLRAAWLDNPSLYEAMFEAAGEIAIAARQEMQEPTGDKTLGSLMNENHSVLAAMGVSSPRLDSLVLAARRAGALGAKLSGSGRGGNMIALVSEESVAPIATALMEAGAVWTMVTKVGGP